MSLLSLPRNIRDDIYRRVLAVAHPLYLFKDSGSTVVETFGPEIPRRWRALLYTNRQVYDEASAVLYGLNHFTLVDTTQKQVVLLETFLNCIGSANAGLLSHLCINFPVAEGVDGKPGEVVLREDGLRSLKLLQDKCINLRTLEAFVHNENSRGLTQASCDESQFIQEALSGIDAHFKLIPSLSRIIVRFNSGSPASSVMELMKGLGWVILVGDRGH
ncbi:hypothetical protein V502_09458 [Pseudogymnoascus sp. VKM F-4520 (FW-2644)]|nr:hypothetical protein V502_09458 [Pseudogymnoascus sp. VKM F-4520 (FW-2644)]